MIKKIWGWLVGDVDKRFNKNYKLILGGIELLFGFAFIYLVLFYWQFNDMNEYENYKGTIRNLKEGSLVLCPPKFTMQPKPINGTLITTNESREILLGNYTIPNPNPLYPNISKSP